jgi:hypothetical protein
MQYNQYVTGGSEHKFSQLFQTFSPPINADLLIYNNDPQKYNRRIKAALISSYLRTYPKLKESDPIKFALIERMLTFDALPNSIVTSTSYFNLETILNAACIFVWLYDRNISKQHPIMLYLFDAINNIDYRKFTVTDSAILDQQFNRLWSDFVNSYKNPDGVLQLGSVSVETTMLPVTTSTSILDGFRTDFYSIYKSRGVYFRNKNVKRNDYRRLLKRAPDVYRDMKNIGMTDNQDRLFQALVKRIENLIDDN